LAYRFLRSRVLATSMLCGASVLGVGLPAAAQTANDVAEIVVTGTRIPTPNLDSVSPVTAIGAQEFKAQGVTRVEDMINTLPQAFAAQGGAVSNGSTGTATVDLRGLGATRTLVLVDGRRLMPGTPNTSGAALAADLNFIPGALVQRVDVLTGGASAVYGADAVAGVVNFIMEKNFKGVRLDAQYGLYQHENSSFVADIVDAARRVSPTPEFYKLPKHNVRDGENSEVTLVIGADAPDGKGNVTAYAGYRHVEPILQGNRDYSACTLNSGSDFTTAGCGGSGTAYPARIGNFVVDVASAAQQFKPRAAADVYNFGPVSYYQRPDDRYVMGAFAHYELAPWATAYVDAMFMDDTSTYQIAPGGIFAGTFTINCANPLMSAQQRGLLSVFEGAAGETCGNTTNPNAVFKGTVARRNVEGGGRQGRTEHTQYRYVVGLRGDLNDAWNYDAYMQYGRVSFSQVQSAFFRTQAIDNALDVVTGPNGQPVCRSVLNQTDTACVPYNIFRIGGVTQEALNYLQTPAVQTGSTYERVVNFTLGGDLTGYGVKSPWADDGVGVSVGAEYRREQLDYAADYVTATGALNGGGGEAPPVHGSFDVYEVFGEARVPLVSDAPLIKRLTLELAYRYSDYSSSGTTDTYKIAGDWQPVDDLRFRASYQRAVRAPHVLELFSPQSVVLDGNQDPCAGLAANSPLVARCAQAFGLTTTQVLAIEKNPSNQYYGKLGGNPNLDPEKSDTLSFGIVATPSFLPGFNFSADWFDIKVKDYISGIGADVVINRCVNTLNPFFCNLVHRDTAGSLWLSSDGYVTDTTLNTGALQTRGIDFNASYRTDLDAIGLENMGGVTLTFVGTWLDSRKTQPLPGDEFYDCAGLYGTICQTPNPTWRHKARLTWNTPFQYGEWIKDLGLSLQWRHFNKVTLDAFDADPQLNNPEQQKESDRVLNARDYFDLTATWTVRDNLNFRAGVNNLFDKDPPLVGLPNCPTGPCNGNTWAQVYDAYGRYAFIGLTADF